MRKKYNVRAVFIIAALTILPLVLFAQSTKWTNDKAHTSVKFEVGHLGVSLIAGQFMDFEGYMLSDKADFTDAKIDFTIQTKSVNTNVEMRDKDLRSENFFDAAKYPEMTLKSVSFNKEKSGRYILAGDLTIKDVTKPVKFHVTSHSTITDPWGNTRTGFRAELLINRFDYHINYKETFGDHMPDIAQDVKIIIDTELTKAK